MRSRPESRFWCLSGNLLRALLIPWDQCRRRSRQRCGKNLSHGSGGTASITFLLSSRGTPHPVGSQLPGAGCGGGERQLPSSRQTHARISSFSCDGEFAPIFPKTLGHSAPDVSNHPLKNIVRNCGSSLFYTDGILTKSPLISGDRRGAFLFEKRGNLKQSPQEERNLLS